MRTPAVIVPVLRQASPCSASRDRCPTIPPQLTLVLHRASQTDAWAARPVALMRLARGEMHEAACLERLGLCGELVGCVGQVGRDVRWAEPTSVAEYED